MRLAGKPGTELLIYGKNTRRQIETLRPLKPRLELAQFVKKVWKQGVGLKNLELIMQFTTKTRNI